MTTAAPVVTEPVVEKVTELLSIKELNKSSVDGSHATDNYVTASLEINYRESLDLRSSVNGYTRYDKGWYPRIKKVNDNLYVLFFMYGQYGQHLYWATSEDGQNWDAPQVLWNSSNHKFTYTDGPLAGTDDRYYAVNADACVLDNGDILCVYAVRPNKGYESNAYTDMNGLYMMRGKVSAANKITWSAEEKIYTGHLWEPFIRQRSDGQIEIYWSSIVAYVDMYGFDQDKRSTCTTMIVSNDNGYTWTPDVQPGDKNHYVATRIFQQAIGNKVPYGTTLAAVPYFGGQMPSAVELYNGKTLLAVEVQNLAKDFYISLGISEEGGEWEEIDLLGTGPATRYENLFAGGAPYLARFPSGEVYLTYGSGAKTYGRMVSPDGTMVDSYASLAAEGVRGSWASTEVVGSHELIVAAQSKVGDLYGIHLVHAYLNHRINSPKMTVTVDGYTGEWKNNTDALFVGSESQAQITLRTAHDDENVYFLVSRLDNDLRKNDLTAIQIADGAKNYYQILLYMDGTASISYVTSKTSDLLEKEYPISAVLFGTLENGEDTDEGAVMEIAVPKDMLGLAGKDSFQVRPMLKNVDDGKAVTDSLTELDEANTLRWPADVLD